MSKLKIYSSKKIKLTDEEQKEYDIDIIIINIKKWC